MDADQRLDDDAGGSEGAGGPAGLVATAMLVGLVASVVGLRRAVAVQPALAFGGP